jgi:hypothetical protein
MQTGWDQQDGAGPATMDGNCVVVLIVVIVVAAYCIRFQSLEKVTLVFKGISLFPSPHVDLPILLSYQNRGGYDAVSP